MSLPEITWTPEFKETHAFYDRDGKEILLFDSISEYLDDRIRGDLTETVDELLANDAEFEIFAFERDSLGRRIFEFLDDLLEHIGDSYGNPDGGKYDEIKDLAAVKAAEQAFIDVLAANYVPWTHSPVLRITVPFRAWFEAQTEKYQASLREG